MSEVSSPKRGWRLDSVGTDSASNGLSEAPYLRVNGGNGSRVSMDETFEGCAAALGSIRRWDHAVRSQVRSQLGRFGTDGAALDRLLHEFAAIVATTDDPAVVEAAFVRAVRLVLPARRVELIAGSQWHGERSQEVHLGTVASGNAGRHTLAESNQQRPGVIDLVLRSGARTSGVVRIHLRVREQEPINDETIRRLNTLCTIAAGALESLNWRGEWHWETATVHSTAAEVSADPTTAGGMIARSIAVHDATFLSAVLPFALNQRVGIENRCRFFASRSIDWLPSSICWVAPPSIDWFVTRPRRSRL